MRRSRRTSFVAWSVLLALVAPALAVGAGEPDAAAPPAAAVIAPAASAVWAEVPTPEGGPVSAFLALGDGLLAAGGPVFRSKTGATWTRIPSFAPGPVGVLAASGAGLFALTPSAVFRSPDGGTTWVELPIGALSKGNHVLLDMSATKGTLLVAANRIGLIRHDRTAWALIPLPAGASLPSTVATDGTRHFAFISGKLWTLDDGSPELKATEGTDPFERTYHFAVSGKKLYALGDWPAGKPRDSRGEPFTRVAISPDAGKTWTYRDSPAGGHALEYRPVIARGELFVAGKKGVFSTRDDGKTWTPVGTGHPEGWTPAALAVTAKGVVVGDRQGVLLIEKRSGTWRPANAGLGHRDAARKLLPAGKDVLVLLASEQLLPCSSASCGPPVLKGTRDAWAAPGGAVLASAAWQEVPLRLSRDSGKTWLPARGLPAKAKVDEVVADRGALFARIGEGLFSSSDGGESWRPAGPLPPCQGFCGPEIMGAFGAGFHVGLNVEQGAFLQRSLDGGRTWTQVPGTISPERPLAFRAMAGDGGTVFVSVLTMSGVRVFRVDADARKRAAGELLLLPKEDGVEGGLLVGGRQVLASSVNRGLLVSSDEGDTWSSFAPQPPGPLGAMLLHDGALYGTVPDGRAMVLPLARGPGAR